MASLSRFRGCLVGAVIGDCIGAIYECEGEVKLSRLLKTVIEIEGNHKGIKKGTPSQINLQFTDDTAMARSVASSLIANRGLNVKDMAKKFSDEYHKEPHRGYGGSVCHVFKALRQDPDNVFGPASRQFEGEGSYGNGAAMRIAPAALFCLKDDFETLKNITIDISKVTHSHADAIHGAVLQSSAVDLALRADSSKKLDRDGFLDQLIDRLKPLEEKKYKDNQSDRDGKSALNSLPFCEKLEHIREFLKEDVTVDEIEEVLGTDISALDSVPAAIYSFLRATDDIPSLMTENCMKRTILLAISLGGDTDTIATMAAAMAGAFYGYDGIPDYLQTACEGIEDALEFANSLWDLQEVSPHKKAKV